LISQVSLSWSLPQNMKNEPLIIFKSREIVPRFPKILPQFHFVHCTIWTLYAKLCPIFSRSKIPKTKPKIVPQFWQIFNPQFWVNSQQSSYTSWLILKIALNGVLYLKLSHSHFFRWLLSSTPSCSSAPTWRDITSGNRNRTLFKRKQLLWIKRLIHL